jgi:hypothetical protein
MVENVKSNNKRDSGNCSDGSGRLGEFSLNSGINGTGSVGTHSTSGEGQNITWKLTPIRDTTAGKILERLEAIEAKHLEYLHSHRSRLKARLGENLQEEEEFLRESNQIKSDIYHLAVAQQNSNGNGHH